MERTIKNKDTTKIDYGIILSVFLLFLISLATMYATTVLIAGNGLRETLMHAAWYGVGVIAVIIIMQFDSKQLWRLAPYMYGVGIFGLILVLFFYDRSLSVATGAKSWLRFGPLTFQPAEVAKITLIMMLSRIITTHNMAYEVPTLRSDWLLLGKIVGTSMPVVLLVILEKDLGTTIVLLAIVAGVTLLSGISWKILLPIFMTTALIGGLLIYLAVEHREVLTRFGFQAYQFKRIDSWFNPFGDTSGDSLQVAASITAIGSGQVFGKGFGVSELVIPVRESDMIFSTIGENFGFLGSAFLVFVYFMLVYRMIRICFDTRNEFYTYIAVGVISMIVFHVFENIGMSIGLLPLTGIPLPFISQGGSALLSNMMGVGLLMSMRYHYKSYAFSELEHQFTAQG